MGFVSCPRSSIYAMMSSRKLVNRVIALQRRRAEARQRHRNHSARSYSPAISNISSIAPSAYDYAAEQHAESHSFENDSLFGFRNRTQSYEGQPSTSTPTAGGFLALPAPNSFRYSRIYKPTQPGLRQFSADATSSARVRGDPSRKPTGGRTTHSATSRAASTSALEVMSTASRGSVRATLPTISYLKSGEYKPISTSSRVHIPRSNSHTMMSGLPVPQRVLSPPPSSAQALSESWSSNPHQPRLRRVGSGGTVTAIVNQIEESEDSREEELRRVQELFPGNPGRKRTASRELSATELKRLAREE
jgi:hypothetical protein